jgi:hypothetical protein
MGDLTQIEQDIHELRERVAFLDRWRQGDSERYERLAQDIVGVKEEMRALSGRVDTLSRTGRHPFLDAGRHLLGRHRQPAHRGSLIRRRYPFPIPTPISTTSHPIPSHPMPSHAMPCHAQPAPPKRPACGMMKLC